MAKQRRDRPSPAKSQSNPRIPLSASARPTEQDSLDPAARLRREAFLQAVTVYEQAMQALQRHEFGEAARLLRSVVERFPEEADLHERVRLYLKICERQAAPAHAAPQTTEERIYAATIALNAGAVDEALGHLRAVLQQNPENDHALYMLALAHMSRNDPESAALTLRQAIALNPENRSLAKQAPEFDNLRQNPEIKRLLDSPAGDDQRRPGRNGSDR